MTVPHSKSSVTIHPIWTNAKHVMSNFYKSLQMSQPLYPSKKTTNKSTDKVDYFVNIITTHGR